MSKIFISLFLVFSFLSSAKALSWTHTHTYTLKKDKIADIRVATSESKGLAKSNLSFRWTTVVGDRVTILLNNRGYPHQYILYKKRLLNKVRLYLLPNGGDDIKEQTYLMLVLTDINQDKKEVSFDILIKDDRNRILVEFK